MPANERALRATDAYRLRMTALHGRARAVALVSWRLLGPDLDATHRRVVERAAPALTQLQLAGARLSSAYLAAFLGASLAQRPVLTGNSAEQTVGLSRAGKPLSEALEVPLITVKKAIADGQPFEKAIAVGSHQLVRNAAEDVMHATRAALFAGISADSRIIGWRRVTGGGCGACMAAATGAIHADDEVLPVHDNCQCAAEPVVARVREIVRRPTGREMFEGMPVDMQDRLLGPRVAKSVRDGQVDFRDLVGHSPMEAIPDQITQKPLTALIGPADLAHADH